MIVSPIRILLVATGMVAVADSPAAEMIHLYARQGNIAKVMVEIDSGVPIDLPSTRNTTESGVSPLFMAAKFGHAELVRALIDAGADFTTLFDASEGAYAYGTPLHVAAAWGREAVVDVLLAAGADADRHDPRIGTPLQLARVGDHQEIAEKLIAAGARLRVEQPGIDHLLASADLELGQEVAVGCGICHALVAGDPDSPKKGPSLWNVVGRAKAAVEGFEYSRVLSEDEGVWTFGALNSFLASPYLYLPGTKMAVVGIPDADRRAALIAYLRTQSDDPVPLP